MANDAAHQMVTSTPGLPPNRHRVAAPAAAEPNITNSRGALALAIEVLEKARATSEPPDSEFLGYRWSAPGPRLRAYYRNKSTGFVGVFECHDETRRLVFAFAVNY
jgi:hypothetical protein